MICQVFVKITKLPEIIKSLKCLAHGFGESRLLWVVPLLQMSDRRARWQQWEAGCGVNCYLIAGQKTKEEEGGAKVL